MKEPCRKERKNEDMNNKIKKWLLYVAIIVLGSAIAGEFGLLAGLVLIFILQ